MQIAVIGLDLAKNVFQVHGIDDSGQAAVKRKLRRSEVLPFFAELDAALVGIEACQHGTLLGTRNRRSWARCPSDAAAIRKALCQEPEERCRRHRRLCGVP